MNLKNSIHRCYVNARFKPSVVKSQLDEYKWNIKQAKSPFSQKKCSAPPIQNPLYVLPDRGVHPSPQ